MTIFVPVSSGVSYLLPDGSHFLQALGIYTTLTKTQAVKTRDELPPAHGDPQIPSTDMLKSEQVTSS